MNNLSSALFRGLPIAFAICCMAYMTYQLYYYLKLDAFGYLPHVGYWFVGAFLALMTAITKGGLMVLNLFFMAGMAGLVLIY